MRRVHLIEEPDCKLRMYKAGHGPAKLSGSSRFTASDLATPKQIATDVGRDRRRMMACEAWPVIPRGHDRAHLMFATSLFVRTGSRDSRITLMAQKTTHNHAAVSNDPRMSEVEIATARCMVLRSPRIEKIGSQWQPPAQPSRVRG